MSVTINRVTNEITLVTPPRQTITIASTGIQGAKGLPGTGVENNALTIGSFMILWNQNLNTMDITYTEVL